VILENAKIIFAQHRAQRQPGLGSLKLVSFDLCPGSSRRQWPESSLWSVSIHAAAPTPFQWIKVVTFELLNPGCVGALVSGNE
jgi:hypothetical protein